MAFSKSFLVGLKMLKIQRISNRKEEMLFIRLFSHFITFGNFAEID